VHPKDFERVFANYFKIIKKRAETKMKNKRVLVQSKYGTFLENFFKKL
jgi:SRSO17 transposase